MRRDKVGELERTILAEKGKIRGEKKIKEDKEESLPWTTNVEGSFLNSKRSLQVNNTLMRV